MKTLSLFKSRMSMIQYITPEGDTLVFANGVYATDKKDIIDHLTSECNKGHPYLYIDPEQPTITEEQLDPHYALRERIRAEEIARINAAIDAEKNVSTSDNRKGGAGTGIQSSVSINSAAVESGTSAALAALTASRNVASTDKSA